MPLWLVIIFRVCRLAQRTWDRAAPAVGFPVCTPLQPARHVGRQNRLLIPGNGWMRMVPLAAGAVRPPGDGHGRQRTCRWGSPPGTLSG